VGLVAVDFESLAILKDNNKLDDKQVVTFEN